MARQNKEIRFEKVNEWSGSMTFFSSHLLIFAFGLFIGFGVCDPERIHFYWIAFIVIAAMLCLHDYLKLRNVYWRRIQ